MDGEADYSGRLMSWDLLGVRHATLHGESEHYRLDSAEWETVTSMSTRLVNTPPLWHRRWDALLRDRFSLEAGRHEDRDTKATGVLRATYDLRIWSRWL